MGVDQSYDPFESQEANYVDILGKDIHTSEKVKLRVLSRKSIGDGSVGTIYPIRILEPSNVVPEYFLKGKFVLKAVEITDHKNIPLLEKEFQILSSFTTNQQPSTDPSSKHFNHDGVVRSFFKAFFVDNIVDIVEFPEEMINDEAEKTSYFCFVLEYCDFTLECLLETMERGELEVPLLMKMIHMLDLFDVTSFLHSRRIIHRDLRPDNIMVCKRTVTDENSKNNYIYEQLKLIDFGLSTREFIGTFQSGGRTVCFTAPEVIRNQKNCDYRVDVWSIGFSTMLFLLGISGRSESLVSWKSKKTGKGLLETSGDYEMRTRECFMDLILQKRLKLDLEDNNELSKLRVELFQFILDRMLVKYERRISFADSWIFMKRLLRNYMIKSSLIDPNSCSEIIHRAQLYLFWNKCMTIPSFKDRVGLDQYLLEKPNLYDVYHYGATHKHPVTDEMTFENPLFHLMIEFGTGHEKREYHSSGNMNTSRKYFSSPKGFDRSHDHQMAFLRYFFVKDHCERFCGYRRCMLKSRSWKEKIKCLNFRSVQRPHNCAYQYCSEKCRDNDWNENDHDRVCRVFTISIENNIYFSSHLPKDILSSINQRSKVRVSLQTSGGFEAGEIFDYFLKGGDEDLYRVFSPAFLKNKSSELDQVIDRTKQHEQTISKQERFEAKESLAKSLLEMITMTIAQSLSKNWTVSGRENKINLALNENKIRKLKIEKSVLRKMIEIQLKKMECMEFLRKNREFCVFHHKPKTENPLNKINGSKCTSLQSTISSTKTSSFPPQNYEEFLNRKRIKPKDMEEIYIKDLKLNEISVNKRIRLRFLSSGYEILGIGFVVEDEKEDFVHLQIYNISTCHRVKCVEGSRVFVIHPFFKMTASGEPTIRVDMDSNIIIIPNLVNELFKPVLVRNSEEHIKMGNEYFRKKEYWNAVLCYERAHGFALEEFDDENEENIQCLRILNNMFTSYLKMKNIKLMRSINTEYQDYWPAGENDKVSERPSFRKSKFYSVLSSLYYGNFEESKEKIRKSKKFLDRENVESLEIRMNMMKDQLMGNYDFLEIIGGKQLMTDYSICEKRRNSSVRIGMYSTTDLRRGDWVLLSNADIVSSGPTKSQFTYEIDDDDVIKSEEDLNMRSKLLGFLDVNQNLKTKLFPPDGEENGLLQPDITIEKIRNLVKGNRMMSSQIDWYSVFSRGEVGMGEPEKENLLFFDVVGFRRSESPNCTYTVIGNTIIVTANCSVGKGKELSLNKSIWNENFDWYEIQKTKCNNFLRCVCESTIHAYDDKGKDTLLLDLLQFLGEKKGIFGYFLFTFSLQVTQMVCELRKKNIAKRYINLVKENIQYFLMKYKKEIWVLWRNTLGTKSWKAFNLFMQEEVIHHQCEKCGCIGIPYQCSRCKRAFYCSIKCQKRDWKNHKKNCKLHCKQKK